MRKCHTSSGPTFTQMPDMSGTEVKPSSLGGRGLFANENYFAGYALLEVERSLIAVLDKPRVEDTCSRCFSGAGITQVTKVNWCTGCKKVKYCSKRCQSQAWKAAHKKDCKIFTSQPELVPNLVAAVMQILKGLSTGDALYKDVVEMESHRDDFEKEGGKKFESMQLMAHTALKFLGKDESNLERAIQAICILMCNSSRLVTPTFDPLGLTLDPRTSAINHSCTPNAVVVFDGPKLSVRALDRIRDGEEIFISYIDSSAPFGVRQAELKDQYFFTCACSKCRLGVDAPQDAFNEPGPEFEERIKVIDDMIPQITQDPAWPRHILGSSTQAQRLSALQFYAYSFLESPDAESESPNPAKFRNVITICRNTGIFPITRAPLPGIYQQYAVACLGAKRYNEALIALLRMHVLIDPVVYPQPHHPVRAVHAWTLATLAKAVSSKPDTPFCQAVQACGVDLSVLFLALLKELHEQVPNSHGAQSQFAKIVEDVWRGMMEPGGELDAQYSERGVGRKEWQKLLRSQIRELWPKVKAFAEDEGIAAQIDEALTA